MPDREQPTDEVASEGGSFGNVEIQRNDEVATGSEADETVRDVTRRDETVLRDETGEGRRSP